MIVKDLVKNQEGFATLTTAIIIFFTTLSMALSIQFAGIGELQTGFQNNLSAQSLSLADGCLEEAMLRLRREASYTGGTLTIGNDTCTNVVTGAGGTRTIISTATINSTIIREIRAEVSIVATPTGNTVTLTDWEETLN